MLKIIPVLPLDTPASQLKSATGWFLLGNVQGRLVQRNQFLISVDLVHRSRNQTPGGVNPYSLHLVPETLHWQAIPLVPFTFLEKLKIVVQSMYCRVGLDINPGRKLTSSVRVMFSTSVK